MVIDTLACLIISAGVPWPYQRNMSVEMHFVNFLKEFESQDELFF